MGDLLVHPYSVRDFLSKVIRLIRHVVLPESLKCLRGNTKDFFKNTSEVKWVFKAQFMGDFFDQDTGFLKSVGGIGHF